jgi:threonine synthase
MRYESTRGGIRSIPSVEAIIQGIAPDGGLFVPEEPVRFELSEIDSLAPLDYRQRALAILQCYLDDYNPADLSDCVHSAYTHEKFSTPEIAPLVSLTDSAHILELWHGPTCAFKDMALQILPHLLVKALRQTEETSEIVVLVATSGDTGKAALEGFRDVAGTRVIVFFPEHGVSQVQKLQMVTQEGNNVHAVAVGGANFDDAQNGVKAIFTNASYQDVLTRHGYKFSSANSINWGRLVPQIAYYFSAYADLLKADEIQLGDPINIVVPTGNFGNILAAWYAGNMGLPVGRLVCASNENNILTDFIHTGVYDRNRTFKKTMSPSMDILISSNLERLLFELTGHDPVPVSAWMSELKQDGLYHLDTGTKRRIDDRFWADFCSEAETLETIRTVYEQHGYVADTHTAVALNVYEKYLHTTGDHTPAVIASTASPFKFNASVARAIFGEARTVGKNEFELLDLLSQECGLPIPTGLHRLQEKPVRHKTVCAASEMKAEVSRILGIEE